MNLVRILVVEGESIVAADLQRRLEHLGYGPVTTCLSGEQTLVLAEQQRPDLVLMDLQLRGDMDGITAAQQLEERFQLPVVFLTAHSDDATLQRVKLAHPQGYLFKPFEDMELKSAIEIALVRHHAELEIRRLNRLYDVLSQVNQAIVYSASSEQLLATVCRMAVERGKLDVARIARHDPDSGQLKPVASFGGPEGCLDAAAWCAEGQADGPGHPCRAFRENRPVVCNDCGAAACDLASDQSPARFGFRSVGSFPVRFQDQPWGVFSLCAAAPDVFGDHEVALFTEAAMNVSFALDRFETQRQKTEAEAALQASDERHRAFVQYSAEAIWCLELEPPLDVTLPVEQQIEWLYAHATVVSANQNMAAMHGFQDSAQMLGLRLGGLLPRLAKDNLAYLSDFITQDYSIRERDSQELSVTSEVRHFTSSLAGHVEDGHLHRVWGVKREITDRKQAEEAARQAARDWQTTFDAANDAIWVIDAEHRVLRSNKAAEQLFRRPASEMLGQHCWNIVHGTAQPHPDCPLVRARRSGRRETMELEYEGSWLQVTVDPLRDACGQHTGAVHIVSDITERKKAERERELLQARLTQAQKMEAVGRLAGGVAHDFNNMLGVILGYGEMVFDRLHQTDPLRDEVRQITEAGRRAADLVRRLLAFSRKQILAPKTLDLNEVIRNLEKMLCRVLGEHIALEVTLAPNSGCVLADPGQLDQVIVNLAVNARDAMPTGGKLRIETAAVQLDRTDIEKHPELTPGRHVLLTMTDTGCGMDEQVLSQIFDPFFTTKEVGQGTGLGLASVFGIVKQSGGDIWVESEPGRGSTFHICLPQVEAKREPTDSMLCAAHPSGHREQILVVEDEAILAKLLESVLSQLRYRVCLAANGGEALLLVEEKGLRPDLIITDVVMPNMSGKQLIDRLQRSYPQIKVLYMSGYTDDAIAQHGVLDPGTPFIPKPFTIRDVAAKVEQVLRGITGRS